jgi:hypothetical protein
MSILIPIINGKSLRFSGIKFKNEQIMHNADANHCPNHRQVHLLYIREASTAVPVFEYHVPLPLVEKAPPVLQHIGIAALFN